MKKLIFFSILSFLSSITIGQTFNVSDTVSEIDRGKIYYGIIIKTLSDSSIVHFNNGKQLTVLNSFLKKENKKINVIKEVKVQDELIFLRKNLTSCHKEFKIGLYTSVVGFSFMVLGLVTPDNTTNVFCYIIGGVLDCAGAVIMIDSHKWIGRAGLGFGNNGIFVKYTF